MQKLKKISSNRSLRLAEQIRHVISMTIIKDDFNLDLLKDNFLTIVDVELSSDLKNAYIFIEPMDEKKKSDKVIELLNNKIGYFRKKMSTSLKVKYLPNLKFVLDTSWQYSKNIHKILKNLK